MKTEKQLDKEANAATSALSGLVGQMVTDGVEPAALVEALTSALGVMLASAPRHLADAIDASTAAKLKAQRAATWAALDAVPVH